MNKEIFYIVYHNNSSYYVKYKDKGSDFYSDYYQEAKRYKSIAPALSRLGYSTKFNAKELMKRLNDGSIRQKNY